MKAAPVKILLISMQKDIEVIGIRMLHQLLLDKGYDSRLFLWPKYDQTSSATRQSFAEFVAAAEPAMFGFSLMSCEYHDVCDLTLFIKARFPEIPVIWGGIHPSIVPEMCLEHADYICVGEGETAILDFIRCLEDKTDPAALNNICCLRNGDLGRNRLNPLIDELDQILPLKHVPEKTWMVHRGSVRQMDIALFRKYARYRGTIYSLPTSRGCPYACTYCCNSFMAKLYATWGIRYRSIPCLIDDLKQAVNTYPFIKGINFQDDCFLAAHEDRIEAFCEAYSREVGKPFVARGVPVYLTERKLGLLRKAGLSWIIVGLQSGSDRTCREIYGRKSLQKDFLQVAERINRLRIAPFYDIIMDNPYETDEDRMETIQTLIRTPRPYYPQFFSLTFYPATVLTERAISDGLIDPAKTLAKEYLIYERNSLNDLTRLAAFLPSGYAAALVALYRNNGNTRFFRLSLALSRSVSAIIFEPLTAFRVILRSQQGQWLPAVMTTFSFLGEGLKRFRFQFRRPSA